MSPDRFQDMPDSRTRVSKPRGSAVTAGILAFLATFQGQIHSAFGQERFGTACTYAQKIQSLEQKFSEFIKTLEPLINTHVSDRNMRDTIRRVFEIFRENIKNKERCGPYTVVPFGPAKGFRYHFDDVQTLSAIFNGKLRTILMSHNFNPDDLGGMATLAHEIYHVLYDDLLRRRVSEERYRTYRGQPTNGNPDALVVIPENEAMAIAVSLEMLNIFTKGILKASVLAGKEVRILTQNKALADFFKLNAEAYFRNPAGFKAFVAAQYEGDDALFFRPDLTPCASWENCL